MLLVAAIAPLLLGAIRPPMMPLPEKVTFPSADGKTTLTAHLFRPEGSRAAKTLAVVMLHGHRGPSSPIF